MNKETLNQLKSLLNRFKEHHTQDKDIVRESIDDVILCIDIAEPKKK